MNTLPYPHFTVAKQPSADLTRMIYQPLYPATTPPIKPGRPQMSGLTYIFNVILNHHQHARPPALHLYTHNPTLP